MEDVLKRLLNAEKQAEARVEEADAGRKRMIQEALDNARSMEEAFGKQVEARRKPFIATAEEGAHRRTAELEAASLEQMRKLREQSSRNEEAAIQVAMNLVLGSIEQR